jgi:hypothetical protein
MATIPTTEPGQRAAVKDALDRLGRDAPDIAAKLHALGFRGRQNHATDDVLARYLLAETGLACTIGVHWVELPAGGKVSLTLRQTDFGRAYDLGRFPELLEPRA